MSKSNQLLLVFYGDDFTGSTDALEFMSRAGARSVLFLTPPSSEDLAHFGPLDAIGIAGMTRSMEPEQMAHTLEPAFKAIEKLRPRHVHYKVCSTFDSSPEIGNIGTAIAIGQRVFNTRFTPILVAAPDLGRYSAFGNLFARMGIGSQGEIHRLDRHPSMSQHPVTPAHESDLREHLNQQLTAKIGLIDLIDLEKKTNEIFDKITNLKENGCSVLFFDALYDYHLKTLGEIFDMLSHIACPLFSVGSSGIEKTLGDFWNANGLLSSATQWEQPSECTPLLVLSGSMSPVTAAQIDWAVENGFEEIGISPMAIRSDEDADKAIREYQEIIVDYLRKGKSVIVHTSKGPGDTRVAELKHFFNNLGWNHTKIRHETPKRFGKILGLAARKALDKVPIRRLVIAGGDTSSYIARELGITAVRMIAPLTTGAPLCRAYAPNSPVGGMEVNLKGGQVGAIDYFGTLQKGTLDE